MPDFGLDRVLGLKPGTRRRSNALKGSKTYLEM